MIQPNGSPNNECLEKFTEFQNPGIFVTMMGQQPVYKYKRYTVYIV